MHPDIIKIIGTDLTCPFCSSMLNLYGLYSYRCSSCSFKTHVYSSNYHSHTMINSISFNLDEKTFIIQIYDKKYLFINIIGKCCIRLDNIDLLFNFKDVNSIKEQIETYVMFS